MTAPLVSIGMTVYNGAKYLQESIETIRNQDFPDWEMFISDNGSSDDSWSIVQSFAGFDPRISAARIDRNRGANWNFERVIEAARGKYFLWQTDHDLRSADYLSRTVPLLEEDAHCVLACSLALEIDDRGQAKYRAVERAETRGLPPVARYRQILTNNYCYKIYGLVRRDVLTATLPCPAIYGGDALLLADLALRGSFAQVNEPLFFPRINRAPQTLAQAKVRIMSAINPRGAATDVCRSWRDLRHALRDEHLALLRRSKLALAERWEAMRATVDWFQLLYGV